MKLLFCTKCQDVFNLSNDEKTCTCGRIKGKYLGKNIATYSGQYAIPILLDNSTLTRAISDQPDSGEGHPFEAKVVAQNNKEFKKCRNIE